MNRNTNLTYQLVKERASLEEARQQGILECVVWLEQNNLGFAARLLEKELLDEL